MHLDSECNKCLKYSVCKLTTDYLEKASSEEGINTVHYETRLKCKHEEYNDK